MTQKRRNELRLQVVEWRYHRLRFVLPDRFDEAMTPCLFILFPPFERGAIPLLARHSSRLEPRGPEVEIRLVALVSEDIVAPAASASVGIALSSQAKVNTFQQYGSDTVESI